MKLNELNTQSVIDAILTGIPAVWSSYILENESYIE